MIGMIKDLVTGASNRPKLSRSEVMAAIPVRNSAVEWARETRDEDRPNVALLRIPRRSGPVGDIVAKLFQLPAFRKLELDEIGSDVWEMCDGRSTVDALTRAVCAKYHLNRRQAEASVTAYLKMLAERRLIALTAKKQVASSGRGDPRERTSAASATARPRRRA
jgi:hypothetical protein